MRVLYYPIKEEDGSPDDMEKTKMTKKSHRNKDKCRDYHRALLVKENYLPPEIKHLKTDLFLERVQSSNRLKNEIEDAKEKGGIVALREVEKRLDIRNTEYDVVISLFLAHRSVQAWNEMIELVEKMSKPLAEMVMVQEQASISIK